MIAKTKEEIMSKIYDLAEELRWADLGGDEVNAKILYAKDSGIKLDNWKSY